MDHRILHRAALLALLLPTLLGARGERRFDGQALRDVAPQSAEASVLRSEPDGWRSFEARTGLWLLVADSERGWSEQVAPGIARTLGRGGSQVEFERFARSLGGGIEVHGPELEGALVRVDLPDDRGRAYASIHLPLMLQAGGDGSLLNARRPNVGLFLSGADVKSRDGDDVDALYLPSRPKDLARGALPPVAPKELPGKGRGDLAIFSGRGGSGDEGGDLRNELRRWVGREELAAGPMRAFPKDGRLGDVLKTIRADVRHPEPEDGWYATLASEPSGWSWTTAAQRRPTRFLAQAIPVAVQDGGRTRSVIVGVVAFYTRLFLTPLEAAAHSGDGERFFAAVHAGEIPFFRLGDDVLFYRGHVDRWLEGGERRGGGKARSYRSAVRMAEGWAERARSRDIDRAVRRPLPMRLEPIPEEERRELVDRRRDVRGRVYADDLAEWLAHQGDGLPDGPEPRWVIGRAAGLAELRTSFGAGAAAVASRGDDGGLRRAPRPPGMDDEEEPPPGDEEDEDAVVADDAPAEREEPLDLDELGGEATMEPYTPPAMAIQLFDFYVGGACRAGLSQTAVLDLLYDGPGDGEIGTLTVEWDFFVGDRIVANDVLEFRRESGAMELEFDLACPITIGKGRLEVLVRDGARKLAAESSTSFEVKASSGRTWAALSKPSPQRCLSGGPDLDSDSDFGVAETAGLDADQIGAAVRAFQEQTLRCHAGGGASGEVQLEFTVGCDGVVKKVDVALDETSDPTGAFAACVADTMSYAPFPAHAREEVFFTVPLRFE